MSNQPTSENRPPQPARGNTTHLPGRAGDVAMGIVGAMAGAGLGYFLFHAIVQFGLYALILPGALTGLGCGSLSRHRSIVLGTVCAVVGAIAGIIAEWQYAPFVKDGTLSYFLAHLQDLRRSTQFLIVLGSVMAFWFGLGRSGGAWLRKHASAPVR